MTAVNFNNDSLMEYLYQIYKFPESYIFRNHNSHLPWIVPTQLLYMQMEPLLYDFISVRRR